MGIWAMSKLECEALNIHHGNRVPIVVREWESHSQGKGEQQIYFNIRKDGVRDTMRNPINVLESLNHKAKDCNYKFERLYRNLYNPEFYLMAYANIAKSHGSMTQGADGQTLDNMSIPRINRIIESIRNKSYQPTPARRHYIKKKNGKLRPLGIPSTDDKLVQEVVRMILEAIYEPTFHNCSHGFRPKRSCHTALTYIKRNFTGVTWVVEGDIKACFDNFDHHILINLLRKRIADEAFIELIWKFLKAGYMEQWEYHCTYSGTPQGSGISPVCANIYLSELDAFVMKLKAKFDKSPARRKTTKEYEKASRRYKKARKALHEADDRTLELIREFKDARADKLAQHYNDPFEEGYKAIQYNRYADDFVVGVIGSKKDALNIKEEIRAFLENTLHLEMSEEKTKITHASKSIRYLGFDFKVIHSKNTKRCQNGDLKRVWYGKVFLYIPKEKWQQKAMDKGAIQVKRDPVSGKETWRPMPRAELQNKNDAEIVSVFNAEIRGLYNYYRIAENVSVLHKYYYMVRYSMLKTLAGKHRTNVSEIKKKYMRDSILRIPYTTKSGIKWTEFYHDGFRKGKGYDNINDILPAYIKYDNRNTIVNRLKTNVCEICGEKVEYLIMHHVRTMKSLKGKDKFERKMLEIHRKSLALCPNCFEELQMSKLR